MFLKKAKQTIRNCEKTDISDLLENPLFLLTAKKMSAFMKEQKLAREKAGVKNKEGTVQFNCPNCGTLCYSSFVWSRNSLHGRTGCPTCKIGLFI